MDFKEFKVRYPPIVKFPNLTGEFHLLIYEDPSDRGHAILARSFEATKKLYAKLARKWNYVPELHGYYKIKIVKPSAKIMDKRSREDFRRETNDFIMRCTFAAEYLFKDTGILAPGYAKCDYLASPETASSDLEWYASTHMDCLNCEKRRVDSGLYVSAGSHGIYPIDPQSLVRDRWDAAMALGEMANRFGHLKNALPIKAEVHTGPIYCVNADFGNHCKGVTFGPVTLKNPTGPVGEVLFYCHTEDASGGAPKELTDNYEAEVARRDRDIEEEKRQNAARREAEKQAAHRHYREVLGTIGTGTDRNEMARAVQVSVKYYDDLLEVMAVWAWTLASTGAQACPCVISSALFDKATLLVNGTFFDPSDDRAPEHLKPWFQVIKDYQPAIIQAFKEAGTTTQKEIDAVEPGPVDKSMLN